MELKTIVNELVDAITASNINLEEVPRATRPAFEIAQRTAKDRMKSLNDTYCSELLKNAWVFVVHGSGLNPAIFAQIAEEEAGTITLNAEELYQRLAKPIDAALGARREFAPESVAALNRELRFISDELGIASMPAAKFTGSVSLPDLAATTAHVRTLIRGIVQDDLNRIFLRARLGQKALDMKFSDTPVPVVLVNATVDEAYGLAPIFNTNHTVTIDENTEVTKEFVLSTFETATKKTNNKNKKKANKENQ